MTNQGWKSEKDWNRRTPVAPTEAREWKDSDIVGGEPEWQMLYKFKFLNESVKSRLRSSGDRWEKLKAVRKDLDGCRQMADRLSCRNDGSYDAGKHDAFETAIELIDDLLALESSKQTVEGGSSEKRGK